MAQGAWSQYLEVGIGPDAEVFTKAPTLSSVGAFMDAGLHPKSTWNNPEPEVVVIVTAEGKIVGATLGGIPRHVVRLSYKAMALQREVTKPAYIARNLADTEALARMESVDRFMSEMPGYPGRLYLQISSRLVKRNELARGVVHLRRGEAVNLADLKARDPAPLRIAAE